MPYQITRMQKAQVYCAFLSPEKRERNPMVEMTAVNYTFLCREIRKLQERKPCLLVAIDGRCASGKTTLAAELAERLGAGVIHMDDFFLRPEQRTPERYAEPGGNVDRERFLAEVLLPLTSGTGEPFTYRPFDCHTMQLGEPIIFTPTDITIIEGTYSCHPALRDYYDYRIFLTVSPEEQMARLARRPGADLRMFREKWIPMEERYFDGCGVEEICEISCRVIVH